MRSSQHPLLIGQPNIICRKYSLIIPDWHKYLNSARLMRSANPSSLSNRCKSEVIHQLNRSDFQIRSRARSEYSFNSCSFLSLKKVINPSTSNKYLKMQIQSLSACRWNDMTSITCNKKPPKESGSQTKLRSGAIDFSSDGPVSRLLALLTVFDVSRYPKNDHPTIVQQNLRQDIAHNSDSNARSSLNKAKNHLRDSRK